jgi:hypothetical protein
VSKQARRSGVCLCGFDKSHTRAFLRERAKKWSPVPQCPLVVTHKLSGAWEMGTWWREHLGNMEMLGLPQAGQLGFAVSPTKSPRGGGPDNIWITSNNRDSYSMKMVVDLWSHALWRNFSGSICQQIGAVSTGLCTQACWKPVVFLRLRTQVL